MTLKYGITEAKVLNAHTLQSGLDDVQRVQNEDRDQASSTACNPMLPESKPMSDIPAKMEREMVACLQDSILG